MLPQKKQILLNYLKMKVADGDWRAVQSAAQDLRELEMMLGSNDAPVTEDHTVATVESTDALQVASNEIPHKASEVLSLLRLDDESLVDKLFPDYSQLQQDEA